MKWFFCILVLSACITVSAATYAIRDMTEDTYLGCHAHAMIGLDTVINSRLGLPAEQALGLARIDHNHSAVDNEYMLPLLFTIMSAYLWQDTPEDFYVEVFNQCLDKATG